MQFRDPKRGGFTPLYSETCSYTVEPVLNGHSNVQRKLAVKGRWPYKRG